MKKILLIVLLITGSFYIHAQVGIGTTTPNNTAMLDISDTARGILIPRMTMVQRLAIQNPAEGLMVYQKDSTKGYWHFDGVQWRSIYSSSNNNSIGGKYRIVLCDSITNTQAQAIIAADFGPNTSELWIVGCTKLTSVSMPQLKTAINVFISDNQVLSTVSLPNLRIIAGHLYAINCPVLASLNCPLLESIFLGTVTNESAINIQSTRIQNLNFPVLSNVVGDILIGGNVHLASVSFPLLSKPLSSLHISTNQALTTVLFPLLTQCSYIDVEQNLALPSLSLPALNSVGTFLIMNNYAFSTLSLPALTKFTTKPGLYNSAVATVSGSENLSNIELGNLTQFSNGGFDVSGGKLSSANVNMLLNKFVSIVPAISGKTIFLDQDPAAPPTGQGIIDKATLVANGNNVHTN